MDVVPAWCRWWQRVCPRSTHWALLPFSSSTLPGCEAWHSTDLHLLLTSSAAACCLCQLSCFFSVTEG